LYGIAMFFRLNSFVTGILNSGYLSFFRLRVHLKDVLRRLPF
jgi:hypothetical protein